MKITCRSLDGQFRNIYFYSYPKYREEHNGEHPITSLRRYRHAQGKLLLSAEEDIFKYPDRENKEVDLVFRDGVLHNNAIYKPHPFTLHLFHSETDFMFLVGDMYMTRGVFEMTVETDWGTKNVFKARAIEYDEFKMTLTFDNPSVIVSTTQDTTYFFNTIGEVLRLFPAPQLYPSNYLYPHFVGNMLPIEPQAFYVSNVENAFITFSFNQGVPIEVDSITINEFRWTLGTRVVANGGQITMDWLKNEIRHDGVLIGTVKSPNDVGKLYTTNTCKIELNKSMQNQSFSGSITMNVKSSGNYNVIS